MAISPKLLVGILAWAGALWAALEVAHVETRWDHAICGVWGCGPSLPALASCHMAWLIVLAPLAIVGRNIVPARWRRAIGVTVSVLVLAVIAGVVVREAVDWLPAVHSGARGYFPRRCLFVIATWVDVPLVQLGLLSLLWWGGRNQTHSEVNETEINDSRGRTGEAEAQSWIERVNGYEHN